MTIFLKQSTAVDVVIGPFVDDTDGKTAETALTISQADCQLTKNAGAMAQKNNATAASHLGGGHYKVPFSTTDTNTLGLLRLYVNESGALPVWLDMMVMPANVWDSLFGADRLQVHAAEISNDLITAAAIATGAIDADAIADNAIDAGVLAASAINEIVDAVWDELQEDHADLSPMSMGGALSYAAADDPDLWDASLALYTTPGSAGKALADAAAAGGASAADIADAVWDEAAGDHVAAGSAGLALANARDGVMVSGSTTAGTNLKKAFTGDTYNAAGLTVAAASAVASTVNAKLVSMNGDAGAYDKLLALAQVTIKGLVTPGTNTTTVVTSAGLVATNGFYVGKTFAALDGANAGQGGKLVVGYDGATKRLTIEALTSAMAVGDTFILVG